MAAGSEEVEEACAGAVGEAAAEFRRLIHGGRVVGIPAKPLPGVG